jgi:hypothetical protein
MKKTRPFIFVMLVAFSCKPEKKVKSDTGRLLCLKGL